MDVTKINMPAIEGALSSRVGAVRDGPEGKKRDDAANAAGIPVSTENMRHAVDSLNSVMRSLDKKVSFSFHEKTQRIIMQFHDPVTNETVREIPPKEMIRLLEHMQELVGMFVDESR